MNFFHTLLQKIGIEKPAAPAPVAPAAPAPAPAMPVHTAPAAAAPVPAAPAPAAPAPVMNPANFVPAAVGYSAPKPAAPAVVPMKVVDVVSKLEGMAKSHPELDWKVSIVDMLKMLDMDSSFEARKALAIELNCPSDLMADSAKMNVWLHKAVLYQIAQNGGNIPASLLD